MTTITTPQELQTETNAFGSDIANKMGSATLLAFLDFVNQNSPLLKGLLLGIGADKITIATQTGTYTDGTGIHVASGLVPGPLPANTPPGGVLSPGELFNFGQFADTLAHELGHAMLPGGRSQFDPAANPDQAIAIGEAAEGDATTTEFLVAQQLRVNGVPGFSSPDGNTLMVSDAVGGLGSSMAAALSVNPMNFTNADDVIDSSFWPTAQSIGGPAYAAKSPSTNKAIDYQTLWVSTWFLNTDELPFGSGAILLNTIRADNFKWSGNSTSGWQFTGSNILMSGDGEGGMFKSQLGERVSFTATETGNKIKFGVITLTDPFNLSSSGALLTSSTLIGGELQNEVFQGRAGTDIFEIAPLTGTSTIVCNPGGLGSILDGTGSAGAVFTTDNAKKGSTPNTWTVGTEQISFKSGSQMDQAPAGTDLSGIAFSSTVGELVIKNFGGATGQTVDLFGFDLAQATHGGFLGIRLNPKVAINTTDAGSSSTQDFAVSTSVPSDGTEMFTVTVSGAIASDFEVKVGNSIAQLGAGGTFSVALAAGQTSVDFSLINDTLNDGSSDIAAGATLTLNASLQDSADPSDPPVLADSLSVAYQPGPSDAAQQAPNPTDAIEGKFDSVSNITTYTGDGGDDIIVATGDHNRVDATDSGNDSIVGGTGTNTIIGSAGNNVITLSGTRDFVTLGGGFNTLNGGTGLDAIYANGGSDIIAGNGGTDIIFGGNGKNEIYAGSRASLNDAIAQTQSAAATSGHGDFIAVLDGDNTVVGGSGNDYVTAGSGRDLIVLGSGNDTFVGGFNTIDGETDWSSSVSHPEGPGSFSIEVTGIDGYSEAFTNPYPQPYNGSINFDSGTPLGPANDTIVTGNGNDIVMLGNGANNVLLGSGTDTVLGGMGTDTITAGSGADYIVGGGGNTYIQGGSGNDTLIGGDGNNTIIAGSGNSTIYAADGPGGIDFDDAQAGQNVVYGGAGNDVIFGSAGSDTLVAGTGNTSIYGDAGNEYVVGGSGNDWLQAGDGDATLTAGSGANTLLGGTNTSGTYFLYGGAGTDFLQGGSGTNFIYAGDGGTAGTPTEVLGSQSDSESLTTIYGGDGVDFLQGGAGASLLYAGDGGTSSAPTSVLGYTGDATIYGGLGTDVLQGGSGSNVLYAGDGGTDDAPTTVLGGAGVSTLYGGNGVSLLQDTQSGEDLLVSEVADDSLIGIGNDTLVAGTGNDVMQADSGAVTFEFDQGFTNDTVLAHGGSENIVFGPGIAPSDLSGTVEFDGFGNAYLLLEYQGSTVSIQDALTGSLNSVSFADTTDSPMALFAADAVGGGTSLQTLLTDVLGGDASGSFGSNELVVSVENNDLVSAVNPNDTLSSWGSNSTLVGGGSTSSAAYIYSAGDSASILGGVGRDSIVISGANDTFVASTGNTEIFVNDASAVIQAGASAGVDTIVASVSYTAPTNVNILTLIGTANIAATGNAGNDILTAGAGNDTLVAGTGADTLIGGTGNTTFVINSSSDVVRDTSSTTNNQIVSSVSYTLPTDINTLVLTGTANLIAKANGANDTLVSNSGVDTLIGGSGNDTFVINNPGDVIVLGSGTATIIDQSPPGYSLPSGALTLILSGTGNLVGTADGGNDTLISNSGVDTLFGGSGNDTFVVNNSGDVVVDTLTTTSNTIDSSVSYSLPTNVNTLVLTGSAALLGTGNAAADLIQANSGNDTLVAGTGIATLVAGSGSDTFIVNDAADVVQGVPAGAHDTLMSSVSYSLATNLDTLVLTGTASLTGTANSDNDTLVSNSGVDTLIGGSGNETYIVNNAGDVIQDHSPGHGSVVEASVGYTLAVSSVTLELTGTADLVGSANGFFDTVVGNTGHDTLIAASSFDVLVAGGAATTLEGLGQGEVFVVNSADDVVSASGSLAGTDAIQSSVSYTLSGGITRLTLTGSGNLTGAAVTGNNSIVGNAGLDILYAGSGADTLVAGSGADTLVGGTGSDTFVVNSTADVLQNISGAANNQVVSSISYTLPTNVSILTLTGYGALVGVGNGGNDTLTANQGNDTLIAGAGVANLIGGLGADLFIINNTADVVSNPDFAFSGGADTIQSSVSYTLPSTINILVLTGTAALVAGGNSQADSIVGNAGADTLEAGTGNDTLVAGSGLATLVGSRGNDTFVINNTNDVILDTVTGTDNTLVSSVSYTLPTNVNTFLLTGSAALAAIGNSGNDLLEGNAGVDTLIGGAGNDTLVAGSGPATLIGGAGNDTFIVNSTADVIESASGSSVNVIFSSASYVLPTNVNQLTLTGIANVTATGNAANDTLTGGAGNDTLIAGTGVDTLIGGSGNTTFVVNNQADVVIESFATANNAVQASVSYTLPNDVNTLVLTGTGNLSGTANAGRDTLVSNSGVDTLIGGTGIDTFVVNDAADVLLVSAGANSDSVYASVSYVLPANLQFLALTGTGSLVGTANGGNDTLVANSGGDTLVGGAGNDTFIIGSSNDVVEDTSATASNLIESAYSYTLPTNVNALTLTGTGALIATGNGGSDVIRGNSGSDTLVAGTGVATLIGSSGHDVFVVNDTADVVVENGPAGASTIQSSVSYSMPAGVNTLVLTGTANLVAVANSGSDTLISNSGIDTLIAGSGSDFIVVNNPLDVVENLPDGVPIDTAANYTLSGSGSLTLLGTADLIATGGSGNDTLTAGAGNDTLVAGSGLATMIGGSGNDTFVVNNAGDVVEDTSSSTSNVLVSSVSYTLPTNVDTLTLTGTAALIATGNGDAANTLSANSGNDTLIATAPTDTLYGGAGSDAIYAGWEQNLIYAGSGGTSAKPTSVFGNAGPTSLLTQSTIYGGAGTDVLYGGPGSDWILSGTGISTLIGGSGSETLDGSAGTNKILGGSGSNLIYGGAGTTEIDQGSGTNVIYGGPGGTVAAPLLIQSQGANSASTSSTIYGGSGYYAIYGGPGNHLIYGGAGSGSIFGGTGADSIYGGSGAETLFGSGNDLLVGGSGNQVIQGKAADTVVAGTGNDTLSVSPTGALEFNPGWGHATVDFIGPKVGNLVFGAGIEPSDLTLGVEEIGSNLWLTISDGTSRLDIEGGFSPNVIGSITFADTGPESLAQLMELDDPAGTVTFEDDGTIVSTGNGQSFAADSSISGIFAFGNADSITSQGFLGTVFVSGNNDTINASAINFIAQGNNDLISDTDGNVTLSGSNTTLVGGQDFIYAYNSSDVIVAAPNDRVFAYANFTLPANVSTLTVEGDSLVGHSNGQGGLLEADGNFDTLIGGAGVDTLSAQGHNEVLVGGSGAETFILTSSSDSVQVGTGAASLNSIQSYFSYTLPTGINSLELIGASLVGVANSGDDVLTALFGDTLIAGSGNDTLVSDAIDNEQPVTMIGGSGNDTFVPVSSADVIIDTWTTTSNTIDASRSYSLPTNINTLNLNAEGAVAIANSANDRITDVGFYGDNTLVAGAGNDTLTVDFQPYGFAGDTLVAGTGHDLMTDVAAGRQQTFFFKQGFSQDQIVTGDTQDVIAFGPGISAGGLTFSALPASGGQAPSLVISGYGGSITVAGGFAPGAIGGIAFSGGTSSTVQQLVDPSGRVTVAGAAGNLILSSSNADSITAGSGEDTVIAWGNSDSVLAGSGGTLVYAEGNNDQVTGGVGSDTLVAFGTADTLIGGSGPETFIVTSSSTVVNASAAVAQDTVLSSVSYTVPDNVSVLTLTGTASLTVTGNSSNDLITGNSAGDTFVAGTGIDTFVGHAGFDPVNGATEDYFEVNNSADVVEVSGSGGFEVIASSVDYTPPANINELLMNGPFLVGSAGDQSVILGTTSQGTNDTLVSGSGVDTFGSAAEDVVLVVNNSADVFQSLNFGDTIVSGVSATVNGGTGQAPEPYFLYSQWILTGTANLVADDQRDGDLQITGNSGNDTLIGADGGYDILVAGSGVDTLIGGGNGSVTTFVINDAADVIITQASAAGNIVDSSISYTLPANISQLTLEATGLVGQGNSTNGAVLTAYAHDTLIAGSGNETLQSGAQGNNTLVPGSGTDLLQVLGSDTVVFAPGFGQAELSFPLGSGGIATVDFATGITGANLTASVELDSNADASLLLSYSNGAGSNGVITLDGALASQPYQFEIGAGSPLTLAQFLAQVTVANSSVAGESGNLILEGTPFQTINAGTGNDTVYAAAAGDTIVGGSGTQLLEALGANDSLVGGSGSDTLVGLGTNDSLVAGSAVDTFIGGTGATVEFFVNNSSDRIQLQSSPGADTVSSSATFTLPANITTLILTAAGIKGSANSAGADTLISSTVGIDTLAGGGGNDTFILNVSGDVVTDTSASAHNTVQAGFSYSLPTDVNTLILTGTAAVTGTGNTAADLIVGNTGADTLTASGTAATTLMGGGGNTTFVVVNSKDVVVETFTGTSDLILSSASYTLPTNVNVLTLTGTAALAATGNAQNDVLNANSGADTLSAGAGLATLNGGTGNDIFVVNDTSDVVNVTATGVTDTIESTVSYVLPANVLKLILEGTAALSATGNSLNDTLTANSGSDTLIAGSGTDSLVGGTGADLFVINSTADVVSVGATHGNDTIQSSVNVTAPANVANITLTGTANLSATGSTTLAGVLTANGGNDTLTAGDTVAGSSVTLVGGAGNDVFSINSTADVVVDTYTATTNTLNTSVSYTLPTNVNILNVTGTAAVLEHGNAGNDSLTANNAADTLVAGNGSDTLVSGTGIDSLVGGTGTDLFIVKNAADIVTVATAGTNDTISSSVSFTLPTNVQYLVLTGTGTVSGTGNGLTDLLVANTGTDTLTGGTGVSVLEGGSGTLAHDTLKAPSAQAALIAGGGASTLTGGAFKDFFAAGAVSDTITTGATANVISVNKGDGATTFMPTTGASDVLSLGAGIDTENLTFTKSGTANLILSDGVSGDSITFTNWYTSTNNQDIKTLQVVEQASASYNAAGSDPLRNKPLEEFNFTSLVAAFTTAGSPAGWSLSTGMSAAALASSATSAYGGDLAYYFGLNGNLTGMTLSAAQSALTNTSFATAPQTIDSWSSISGGGLNLLVKSPAAYVDPVQMQWLSATTDAGQSPGLIGSEVEPDADRLQTAALLVGGTNTPPLRTEHRDSVRTHGVQA